MPGPVIFVPGLPSSHLLERNSDRRFYLKLRIGAFDNPLLRGPNDLQTDDGVRQDGPIASVKLGPIDLAKQAKSLYKLLRKHGIEPVKFGWDWRRPVSSAQFNWTARPRLARTIRDLRRSGGERVTIIAHSTGGLVLRSCLEAEPQLAVSIKRIIAFGVPWAGTPQSMLYINRQSGFAGGLVSRRKAQEIVVHSWAGFDLFPPDPTHLFDEDDVALNLTYRRQGTGKRQVSALTDRHWINSLPEGLRAAATQRCIASHSHLGPRRPTLDLGGRRLDVVNVVGFGFTTPVAARLARSGANGTMDVEEDREDATLDGGDGTVPRKSAAWLRGDDTVDVRTHHVPIGVYPRKTTQVHSALWNNPGSINLLDHHLGGRELRAFCYAAIDADDWRPGNGDGRVRVRCVALDERGAMLDEPRVRTLNYQGGNIAQPFDPDLKGRHLITLERQRIPRSANGAVRRLMLELQWKEDGQTRRQQRTFQIGA